MHVCNRRDFFFSSQHHAEKNLVCRTQRTFLLASSFHHGKNPSIQHFHEIVLKKFHRNVVIYCVSIVELATNHTSEVGDGRFVLRPHLKTATNYITRALRMARTKSRSASSWAGYSILRVTCSLALGRSELSLFLSSESRRGRDALFRIQYSFVHERRSSGTEPDF